MYKFINNQKKKKLKEGEPAIKIFFSFFSLSLSLSRRQLSLPFFSEERE